MKRLSKRVLALLLSVCLLLGAFPALPAAAQEGDPAGITRAQLAVSVYHWFLPDAGETKANFTDIDTCSQEEQAAINILASAGLLQGTGGAEGESTFSPSDTVTRAQAAVVLYRAMRETPVSTDASSLFDDVSSLDDDVKNAILYLEEEGVLTKSDAIADKNFSPNAPVTQAVLDTWLSRAKRDWHLTRADLAVMVCDAFDLTYIGGEDTGNFTDLEGCTEAQKKAIKTLANLGIVSGTADSTFNPFGLVNRMTAAMILYQVYDYFLEDISAQRQTIFTDEGMYTAEGGTSINIIGTAFNLLVSKDVLSKDDILYPTGEETGLFVLNAMANKTTVQGWLNKAAAELNPLQGHTVTVSVTGVESVPDYTVHWYQNGQELASGTSITVTDTSAPLYYEIVLDNDALKQYSMTNGSGAVEFDTGNSTEITVTLASHQTVSVEGTVKGENKQLISGATVTLTQNYSATVSEPLSPATTDASGAFNIPSAKAVPSVIKISAPGYYDYTTAVSLDVEVEADADATSVNLETFQLTPLPDSQVTLSLSLQAAAAPGEPPATTALTSFANLEFTVQKDNKKITQFTAQYPTLVFDEGSGVTGGDTLTISVEDTSGKAVMSGEAAEVKLNSDGSGSAELTLVENGKIAINALAGADQATVLVFDDAGSLAASGAAWGAYTSPSLPSGQYTVVALEKTDLLQSVSSLSQLAGLGLSGNNYVQTTATVSNGVITEIARLSVPELNEDAISYTTSASVTVDVATASVGRNVTLRVEYQLKEQFADSQVSLEIALPLGLEFNGNPTLNSQSVTYTGNNTNTYTISGTGSGVVRVFLIGNTAGSYDISPRLTINGASRPVGTAHVDVTAAQIYVPSTTGKNDPHIYGLAAADSQVTVYVDGEPQKTCKQEYTTTADKTGLWQTTLSLPQDAGYHTYEIYAQCGENSARTETKTLLYDPDYIDVSKVTMYNVVGDREQAVTFNYDDPFEGGNYFTVGDEEFTFVIEFDNSDGKDCDRLANVRLNLFTQSGQVYTEPAQRMGDTNQYTAQVSGIVPVNVGVEYLCKPVEENDTDTAEEPGFTDAEFDQYQTIVTEMATDGWELKSVRQWEDAMALVLGVTGGETDTEFSVLLHLDSFPDQTVDDLKAAGFAKMNNSMLELDDGEKDSTFLYRMSLSEDGIQHIFVTVGIVDSVENPALVITIPIDFSEIVEGLEGKFPTEEEQEALRGDIEENHAALDASLLRTSMDQLNTAVPGELTIKVRDFPYSGSPDKGAWWKSFPVRALLELGENGAFVLPYTAQLAALCDIPLMTKRLQEWEKDLDGEIEYQRERIRQMEEAVDCWGRPVITQEELTVVKEKLAKIIKNGELRSQYWTQEINKYYGKITASAGLEAVMSSAFKTIGRKFASWVLNVESKFKITTTVKDWMTKLGQIGEGFFSSENSKVSIRDILEDLPGNTVDNTSTAKDFFEWAHEAATKGLPPEDGLATDVAPGDGTMEQMGDLVDIGGAKYHLAMDNDFDDAIDEVAALDSDLNKILGNSRKNCPPEPLPTSEEEPEKSPCKDKIYGIDPSGYVYEAVPSNRLAGVEAKIYQQTSGAYSEWTDAKNYGGQSSTIETGPTGQYRWDVPTGTWKVEVSREGYQTSSVSGLEVPPPQTDVNIAMKSTSSPTVKKVQAYSDGVLVEFSQYMDIDSVKESITLTVGGNEISCTVEPVNAETDTNIKENAPTYASRFFVKPADGAALSGEVTVKVASTAKSYNDKPLGTDYTSNESTVSGERPTGIEADPLSLLLGDGKSDSLSLALQPGVKGAKLTVEILTPSLLAFAEGTSDTGTQKIVTTGDNGVASVSLQGRLPGTGKVRVTHGESGLTWVASVAVVTDEAKLAAPGAVTATVDGQTLTAGETATIAKGSAVTLTADGAEIWYTLDGSCPKAAGAKKYTGPITINRATTLRAVAVVDRVFGSVSTWKLTVSGGGGGGGGALPQEPETPFTDVSQQSWYYNAVQYVYENGLMAGTSAATFEPNATLSRGMVAQILYNLEGQPTVEGESAFTDTNTHWAAKAIAWAQKNGVVSGYENNIFRPNKAVTREELAQMLYNYAQHKGYDLTSTGDLTRFPDGNSVSVWAETAMAWANGKALINGFEDNTLQPGGNSTRAQAASILMKFDQNLVEN